MSILVSNEYKKYNTEQHDFGTTEHWQKRIDTKSEYKDYPLCNCNDKLFLNITYSDFMIGEQESKSYGIFLVHENKQGEWCDLKIYSISESELAMNLKKYEKKLLDMWLVFYGE